MAAFNTAYKGWEIEKVESMETPDFEGLELEIEKGKMEITINKAGTISEKKESKEEEDEKED